jgi:hypothetical protein
MDTSQRSTSFPAQFTMFQRDLQRNLKSVRRYRWPILATNKLRSEEETQDISQLSSQISYVVLQNARDSYVLLAFLT